MLLVILRLFYCEYITIQTINATSYYRGNRRWPNIAWRTYCIHQYMVWKGLNFKSFIIRLASYLFEVKFDSLWNNLTLQLKVTLSAVRIIWYMISYTLKIELAVTFIIMVENSMEVYFVEYLNAFCHSV